MKKHILAVTLLAAILAGCAGKVTKGKPAAPETTGPYNIDMVFVEGGTFTMGCTAEQGGGCDDDEKPAHEVTVSDFYMGKYPVTQGQWKAVMGGNPSKFAGDDNLPVENVSLDDIWKFIRRLNAKTGKVYRLPTEAEWEYAARGGNRSKGYRYSGGNDIDKVAWYEDNSGNKTHIVGAKQPNELGIYDMTGNVWEFVNDLHGEDYYGASPAVNPTGPRSGSYGVARGGSWGFGADNCRVSTRGLGDLDNGDCNMGFRLVISPATESDSGGVWTSFWQYERGPEGEPITKGYMNKYGNIMIEPIFSQIPAPCHEFDNIIGVWGKIDGEWTDYYLTKTGRIVGKDSLHILEMSADCETEGFIRFHDGKTDQVGLFDRNGNVAIHAEYSYLGRVINGMILALKGAERDKSDAEHWTWVGGKNMLIDTLNNVLIDDIDNIFFSFSDLDFFSLEITENPHPDTTRVSFLAKDGSYYSFVHFRKEFVQWLAGYLSSAFADDTLINNPKDSLDWHITDYWERCITSSRGKINRREFITRNFETMKKELSENPDISLSSYVYGWDYSGNSKERLYPKADVRGALKNKRGVQNCYDFSRAGNGYKLTGVSIRGGGLVLNAAIYRHLGRGYYDVKAYDEAIVYYQKAIDAEPDCAAAYYDMGEAYMKKGEEYRKKAEK